MPPPSDITKLFVLLARAEKLASEFQGGYSACFPSAEEFHKALSNSTNKLKQGDSAQLKKLQTWFLPTSCWDDFVGIAGQDLANEISSIISILIKHNET